MIKGAFSGSTGECRDTTAATRLSRGMRVSRMNPPFVHVRYLVRRVLRLEQCMRSGCKLVKAVPLAKPGKARLSFRSKEGIVLGM